MMRRHPWNLIRLSNKRTGTLLKTAKKIRFLLVAFRYKLAENSSDVCIVESELTSFTLPSNARGGFQVDIAWRDGKLISATIHSDTGEPCSVSCGGKTVDFKIKKGKSITLNGNLDLN
jgi:hypothetical protein